jgi:hypothetical protein
MKLRVVFCQHIEFQTAQQGLMFNLFVGERPRAALRLVPGGKKLTRVHQHMHSVCSQQQTVRLPNRARPLRSGAVHGPKPGLLLATDLVSPPALEAIGRQLGVAHCVLDIPMPQVRLKAAGIMPLISQRKPTSVPQHVWMRLNVQAGGFGCPLHHPRKPCCRKWGAALRDEYEW